MTKAQSTIGIRVKGYCKGLGFNNKFDSHAHADSNDNHSIIARIVIEIKMIARILITANWGARIEYHHSH